MPLMREIGYFSKTLINQEIDARIIYLHIAHFHIVDIFV